MGDDEGVWFAMARARRPTRKANMCDARQDATVGGNWAPSGCGLRRPRGGLESAETAIVTYPHVSMLVHWWERMQVAHRAGVFEG